MCAPCRRRRCRRAKRCDELPLTKSLFRTPGIRRKQMAGDAVANAC
jgi:hypothetical protein